MYVYYIIPNLFLSFYSGEIAYFVSMKCIPVCFKDWLNFCMGGYPTSHSPLTMFCNPPPPLLVCDQEKKGTQLAAVFLLRAVILTSAATGRRCLILSKENIY